VTLQGSLRPVARRAVWRLRLERDARRARLHPADLSLFHELVPAPAGGASQALHALVAECERRGVTVQMNVLGSDTRACLFNSFNFDFERLRALAHRAPATRLVHRVGAVTSLYRGFDDGTDARVAAINRELAHATIAISNATVEMYREIGVELVRPRVIHNPCNTRIFNREGRVGFDRGRRTRLVAVSWSSNPRKGGPVYRWLEDALDPSRYELTFIGNTTETFGRTRHLPPLPSHELAAELRRHDVFVTATENDAYSNALVEALSCGLPAIYLDSGGSGEAVKQGGFPFRDKEEIPALLDRLVDEYEQRQAAISLPTLEGIVDAYLEMLGLDEFARTIDAG
jgi:glycosyltransferase involved in cell wall biosynthesis